MRSLKKLLIFPSLVMLQVNVNIISNSCFIFILLLNYCLYFECSLIQHHIYKYYTNQILFEMIFFIYFLCKTQSVPHLIPPLIWDLGDFHVFIYNVGNLIIWIDKLNNKCSCLPYRWYTEVMIGLVVSDSLLYEYLPTYSGRRLFMWLSWA